MSMYRACIILAAAVLFPQGSSGQITGYAIPGIPGQEQIPELKPEPGDKLYFDSVSGDIVIESRGAKRVIVRRTHTDPIFAMSFKRTTEGASYAFNIRNGAKARQAVGSFFVEVPDFVSISQSAVPPYWWFLGIAPQALVHPARATWGRKSRDDDDTLLLVAGAQATGFSFVANGWPGLVVARVVGYKRIEEYLTPAEYEVNFRGRHSEWALQAGNEYLTTRNDAVPVVILGPKIEPGGDMMKALRAEFGEAKGLAEFKGFENDLDVLQGIEIPAAMAAKLDEVTKKANGFPKEFFEAMRENLRAAGLAK
jgi:hypothetical protein